MRKSLFSCVIVDTVAETPLRNVLCWCNIRHFFFLNPGPVQPFENEQEQRVQWKTDVNKWQMFFLMVSPKPYTESSPINASWRRQRRTLSYNINTSSAAWVDKERRAIVAFLKKNKDIGDMLLEKVRTNSPACSYLCSSSSCHHYKWGCLNRLVAESGAKWLLIKSQSK